jgi:TolB-like protein/DNA-binding winged helix-turn-helix (wHTH) protein/Flp pilus assembly protein TadD
MLERLQTDSYAASSVDAPTVMPGRLKFSCFEADLRSGELTKQGKRLRLQEQPFRLLAMLLERPRELVTREEVRRGLWPHAIVDFDHGLNKAINKIRDVLGDSAQNPRFVETVARRGYRFLADVAVVRDQETQSVAVPQPAAVDLTRVNDGSAGHPVIPDRSLRHRPVTLWIAFGAALAVLLSSGWALYRWQHSFSSIHSVVVLPLANLSGDASQDYFTDGMTDELITQLGQIGALRVISRTSAMTYKNTQKSLPAIARELDVQAVVEGGVLRVGDRVRITAQLIRVPADEHLWAHSYEGSFRDTLALQNNVSQAIAEQIRATLSRQEQASLSKAKVLNSDAYEAYLRGRYFWNKRDAAGLRKAIEYFQRAIAADPGYAEAYSGLADAYALAGYWEYGILSPQQALPLAQAAATRAVTLDPMLAEAHTSLAWVLDQYAWDWDGAEKEYRRALALNPGYALAHHWYAYHLAVLGRTDEGIAEERRAERLDPLSLVISAGVAELLCIAHRFDEAIRQIQRTLEMDPNFAIAYYQLGQLLVQKHMPDAATGEFQRAIELSGHSWAFDASLAHAYALSGHTDSARRIARDLEEGRDQDQDQNGSLDGNIALIYVGLGDADRAMSWLEKAYDARFDPSILAFPVFDPLRSDPRFKNLMRGVGLGT